MSRSARRLAKMATAVHRISAVAIRAIVSQGTHRASVSPSARRLAKTATAVHQINAAAIKTIVSQGSLRASASLYANHPVVTKRVVSLQVSADATRAIVL